MKLKQGNPTIFVIGVVLLSFGLTLYIMKIENMVQSILFVVTGSFGTFMTIRHFPIPKKYAKDNKSFVAKSKTELEK